MCNQSELGCVCVCVDRGVVVTIPTCRKKTFFASCLVRVFLFCFARFPPKFVFCFLLAICSSSCVFFLPIRSCPFLACACRFLTVAWVAAAELSFAHIFFYFAVRTPLTNMCGAQAHIPHTTLSKKHTHIGTFIYLSILHIRMHSTRHSYLSLKMCSCKKTAK